MPFCVAVDCLRPCTPAELLAFHYTQTKTSSLLATDAQTQQGFTDERAPLKPTVPDPPRTVNEDEDEDERDDEVSEPTQITRAEMRKDFQTDATAKVLRAPLIRHTRVHWDLPMKRQNSSNDRRNKPELQKKELRRYKMSHTCSRRGIANIREMDSFKMRMTGMRKKQQEGKC